MNPLTPPRRVPLDKRLTLESKAAILSLLLSEDYIQANVSRLSAAFSCLTDLTLDASRAALRRCLDISRSSRLSVEIALMGDKQDELYLSGLFLALALDGPPLNPPIDLPIALHHLSGASLRESNDAVCAAVERGLIPAADAV